MEENKNNLPFPHSSSTSTPHSSSTSTPHFDQNTHFDQYTAPALVSSTYNEMPPQWFSSFFSGDWINKVELEQPPMNQENSLRMVIKENDEVNHNSLLTNPNNNFETTQYYHSSSTQFAHPNVNYHNMVDDALLFSNSERTHNRDSSYDANGYNNGFLNIVVNSNSTKTTSLNSMTFENLDSFGSNLHNPFLFSNPQTSHFCSPSTSTVSTTHNNGLSTDFNGYTGLISDVVNFDSTKTRSTVPTTSSSTTNLLSSSSLPPRPPTSHNSLRIKNNPRNWSLEEHRLFLAGVQLLGKGEWKKIANYVVITKTHKQVASHAQKYFLHLDSLLKRKTKRSSINNITTVEPEFLAQVEARLPQHLRRLNNKDK